jgi:EmrB/QacA subfamily drug resistance transporter
MQIQTQEQHTQPNKSLLLTIIILTSVVNPFLGAAINIALPHIASELDLSAIQMSWIAMAFLLSSAVFLVPLGKIADIAGRKKIFLIGNIIVTISSIFCALSTSGAMLIAFRVLQGLGSAMMFGTGVAIITSAFPPHERGLAIGINVTAVYIGLSIAPMLGGVLTDAFGWRSLFYITIPFGIVVVVLTHLFIKTEWAEAKNDSFDFAGSLLYLVSMSVFMYGFTRLPDLLAIGLTISGFIGLLFFIYFELRVKHPVLNINLFRHNRVFALSNVAALINYAATFAIGFILSLYLQYIKGLTPLGAGTVLVTQPVVMAIVASFSGRMSDKYPPWILSSVGMSFIVVGLFFLSFLNNDTTNGYLIMCLIIVGVGFGLFSSPNTNSVMSSVEKKYLGVASATISTMRLTGQMLSMGIATLIIQIFIGKAKITPENHFQFLSSVKIIFVLFTVLCLLGVFASMARGKKNATE